MGLEVGERRRAGAGDGVARSVVRSGQPVARQSKLPCGGRVVHKPLFPMEIDLRISRATVLGAPTEKRRADLANPPTAPG